MGSAEAIGWTRTAYEASESSRCWWYTAYDAGWDESVNYGHDLREDRELAAIVALESTLAPLPRWAVELIHGPIRYVPACGHADFPRAYLEAVEAIGREQVPPFIHGCYTASPARKARLADIVFCLDAWLAGASAVDAARELSARRGNIAAWPAVCERLWAALGRSDEVKRLLLERVIHRQRWWLKTLRWDGDDRDRHGVDMYLGDFRGTADTYGNPGLGDPWFAELEVPRVRQLEARLATLCPEWDWFRAKILHSWLCAPKSFRYLEVLLWSIGRGAPRREDEAVPNLLGVTDTWPDQDAAAAWWAAFVAELAAWWQGGPVPVGATAEVSRRLGERTPLKAFLVRLYAHRLRIHARDADTRRLVTPAAGSRRGDGALCCPAE